METCEHNNFDRIFGPIKVDKRKKKLKNLIGLIKIECTNCGKSFKAKITTP